MDKSTFNIHSDPHKFYAPETENGNQNKGWHSKTSLREMSTQLPGASVCYEAFISLLFSNIQKKCSSILTLLLNFCLNFSLAAYSFSAGLSVPKEQLT